MSSDTSRRQFLGLVSLAGLVGLSSGTASAQEQLEPAGYGAAPAWVGPIDDRPSLPLANTRGTALYYAEDTGELAMARVGQDDGWTPLNYKQLQPVFDASDLPTPTGGTHTLDDNTAYVFNGFVTSQYGLELGSATPLLGRHASLDGFIHTGANTALTGTNAGFFARNLYVHAPGGTLLDLTGDTATEMLVESCSFSDAAGLGQLASLGTIDGYRVPTFKGCNFEDFDAGLTFTGTCDKVFIANSPFRTVTTSGVRILHFDADFSTEIVDMTNNYVKDVQSDTEVINVDAAATIDVVFQYRGTTHDPTVTEANILAGAADIDAVGFRVSDSYPLQNSKSFIDYTLDAEATTTISTQATDKTDASAYVRVAGNTTERGSSRFTHSDNLATYVGKRDRVGSLTAALSLGTGTDDVVAVAWFVNGSLVPGTATRVQMNQQGGGIAKTITASGVDGDMETNDAFDVRVANLGSTTNITVGELNAKITT